jgi:hypothetical protein
MTSWNHIILEGYCLYKSSTKKEFKCVNLDSLTGKEKRKETVLKNKHYIPKTERPKWCTKQNKDKIPQFRCMCLKKKCPFFAYANADRNDYKKFNKIYFGE